MAYKVKTFLLVEPDEPEIYETKEEAQKEADQLMFMQPGEILAEVVEVDYAKSEPVRKQTQEGA
jgi:hypothetical protein